MLGGVGNARFRALVGDLKGEGSRRAVRQVFGGSSACRYPAGWLRQAVDCHVDLRSVEHVRVIGDLVVGCCL